MIKINKNQEPEWLVKYKLRNPMKVYKNSNDTERRSLRTELLVEQYYLCGYCCAEINLENSTNEHIIPQSVGRNTLDYDNLIASCHGYKNQRATCGHKKDNNYVEQLFISPLDETCEEYFGYYPNGEIVPEGESARYTIDLLNLNSFELRKAREAIFKLLIYYDTEFIEEILKPQDGKLQAFCNVVKWYYNTY